MNRKNPAAMTAVPINMSASPMDCLDIFVGSGSDLSDIFHGTGLGLGVFLNDVKIPVMF
jgi:hypothetical protein